MQRDTEHRSFGLPFTIKVAEARGSRPRIGIMTIGLYSRSPFITRDGGGNVSLPVLCQSLHYSGLN